MPAYSFNERFVQFVLDGSKTQTVRSRRRNPAKPGDTLYLYYGLRTKHCRKLREEKCTMATSLVVCDDKVIIYTRPLSNLELEVARTKPTAFPAEVVWEGPDGDLFAWLDGFRPEGSTREDPRGAFELMLRFWRQTHSLPWAGDIIYWRQSKTFC